MNLDTFMPALGGLRIIEAPMAMNSVPIKKHVKRRNQTAAYHRRIEKKWKKRYGTTMVPGCWASGGILFVHPDLVAGLKSAAQRVGLQ